MGLREWVYRMLDRGEPPARTPDAPLEIENVPLAEGPMLVRVLEEAGIEAHGIEAFDAPTSVSNRMRIHVRGTDAERASEVISEHRRRLRDGD